MAARERSRRLLSFKALLGLILLFGEPITEGVVWLIDRLSELQFVHDEAPVAANYLQAAAHRLALMNSFVFPLSGLAFLILLVLWPDLKEKVATSLGDTNVLLRAWKPFTSGEIDALTRRLLSLGKHTILIVHNDAVDCGDLADDFAEAFERGGWKLPRRPGVSWGSIGARGISVRGKPDDDLAHALATIIAETTYVIPELGEPLPAEEQLASIEEPPAAPNNRISIDVRLAIMPKRRRPPKASR